MMIYECFLKHESLQGKKTYKPFVYAEIYKNILQKYIGKEVVIAELGIGHGGSLQIWRDFLGDKSTIIGIDNREDLFYEDINIKCIYADQSKQIDLVKLSADLPMLDVFIDDGSHMCVDQILTFTTLFAKVKSGGMYVCEDTHTSYRKTYGGSYLGVNSFIEYSKKLIDSMYYREHQQNFFTYTHQIKYVHFYDTMVIIGKV